MTMAMQSRRSLFEVDPADLPAVLRNRQKDDIRAELLRGKPDTARSSSSASLNARASADADAASDGDNSVDAAHWRYPVLLPQRDSSDSSPLEDNIDRVLARELYSHELHMLRLFKERLARVETSHCDAYDSSKNCEILLPHPVAGSPYSDRYLVLILFARKFDLERCYDLLVQQTRWRRENLLSPACHCWPRFSELSGFSALSDMGFIWSIPGARAKNGGVVQYIELGNFHPDRCSSGKKKPTVPVEQQWTLEEYLRWSCWQWTKLAVSEELDGMRSGITIVEDLKGVTMKNLGMGTPLTEKKVQKAMSSMQDAFPMRLERILILNPPGILKVLLKLARVFGIKKKLLERVVVLKQPHDIFDWVARDQLAAKFGGDIDFGPKQFADRVSDWATKYEAAEDANRYHFLPAATPDSASNASASAAASAASVSFAVSATDEESDTVTIDPALDALGLSAATSAAFDRDLTMPSRTSSQASKSELHASKEDIEEDGSPALLEQGDKSDDDDAGLVSVPL